MFAGAIEGSRIAPSGSTASGLAALFVDDRRRDTRGVVLPRTEIQIVARFGASTAGGLDVHAMGGRERVHRKLLSQGHRAVTARLRLGTPAVVLGVSASALAGRTVALQDLWGDRATGQLLEKLAAARDLREAAAVLEGALAQRLALAGAPRDAAGLALEAARRLANGNVKAVSGALGISERHLRRVFREAVGVGPKTYAKLARFHRALRAARADRHPRWAGIAADAGYYDQPHLIADFRAIAGVTPQALLRELAGGAIG
ncbi:MAG TPA: helix-turn-helix domain-containing protein [Polyangia bacterium]|nr:helix-turn-helix domain-containing protein [Polyangia bacterium]